MKLAYLVREKDGIKLVHKKPAGVRISKNHTMWFLRQFSFTLGVCERSFHYNDLEVIGVFDLENPKHLTVMIKMFESHLRQSLERKVLLAVGFLTPIENNNKPPPDGPGGSHYTPIGSAIIKVFRRGDEHGDW